MSSTIQLLKKKAELSRVTAARLEMEIKLQELNDALDRVKSEITFQLNKEQELEAEVKKQGA